MHVLSPVNIKTELIRLVRDSVTNSPTEEELVATHVVIHHIFKGRHEGRLVDFVKVDFIARGNLNSNIAKNITDESPDFNFMILSPSEFVFHLVKNSLKEKYLRTTPRHQRLPIH